MEQQVLSLLPGLEAIIKYRKQYHQIHQVLESMFKEIDDTEEHVHQFLLHSEMVTRKHTEAVKTQKFDQVHNNTPKIAKSRRRLDQPRSQTKDKSIEKYSKKSINALPHRISLKDEMLRIKEMLKQHRLADMMKMFNQKLERNTKTCQLFTNMLNLEKSEKYKEKTKAQKYWMCLYCDFGFRGEYQKNRISDVVKNHYKCCHRNIKYNSFESMKFLTLPQAFNLFSRRLQTSGNEYYKCNCQIKPCQTAQQYVEHMESVHNNEVPQYSSHLFSSNGHLLVNQNFNQLCVIEDFITHESYYCGQCGIPFQRRPDVFYSHILHYHGGSTDHPLTSHHFKQNCEVVFEKKCPIKKIKRNRGHASFVKQQKMPQQEQLSSQIKPITKLRSFQPKQTSKSLRDVSSQSRVKTKKQQKQVRNVRTSQPFPEEQKFLKMIQDYKGPFVCSFCNKNFESHADIVKHFQSFQTNNTHLKKQKNWMRVKIRKIKQKQQFCMYLPVAEEFMSMSLRVPYYKDNIIQYQQMSYRKFLAFAETKNKLYKSFTWLHYSESQDQQQVCQQDQENREEEQMKRRGKAMQMRMEE